MNTAKKTNLQKQNSVALYIRAACLTESTEYINKQKSMLQQYVNQHHLKVYDIYIDIGFAGTSFERPAFKRMLTDIEAKRIDMVIAVDVSRLGRVINDTSYLVDKYFPQNNVRFISLADNIN